MKLNDLKSLLKEDIEFDTSDVSGQSKDAGRAKIEKQLGFSKAVVAKMRKHFTKATAANLMKVYNAFVEEFPTEAMAISNKRGPQIGPAEMIFYYLFDNIGVGGNQNIDLFIDGMPFAEVKAGPVKSDGAIYDFELSPGGHPAVKELHDDMKRLNSAYRDEKDEDLPDWDGSDISGSAIQKWREMDFIGTLSGIDLSLDSSGVIKTKDDKKKVLDLNKDKSVAPLKKLVGEIDDGTIDIESIIEKWVDAIASTYLKGKRFVLVSNKTLRCVHVGSVTADMLDLYRVTRGRPKAMIYLKGKPSAKST